VLFLSWRPSTVYWGFFSPSMNIRSSSYCVNNSFGYLMTFSVSSLYSIVRLIIRRYRTIRCYIHTYRVPITVTERSKAWIVFACSYAGSWVRIPHKAWMSVCEFILCLSCSMCRYRPCDRLMTLPRNPINVYRIKKLNNRPRPNKGI
jgi:hypothetical protein